MSSIEILLVDRLDVMTMQNWNHVLDLFVSEKSRINLLPKEAHDCDFSRVRPWYLNGHAAHLRQSIFLTDSLTIDIKTLFLSLQNVAGKKILQRDRPTGELANVASLMPSSSATVQQNFERFDSPSYVDDPEARFKYFRNTFFPAILKSAVASERALIFVPSTFDFVRLQRYLKREHPDLTVGFLSEESSNSDVGRTRHAFFQGRLRFVLVSERFHFYRRYRIRGYQTLIFYGPPSQAHFYTEFIRTPLMEDREGDDDEEEGVGREALEGGVRTMFSRWDELALSGLVGPGSSRQMCSVDERRFSFE